MKAIAIILAAGASQRMGIPKALLVASRGTTFLGRLVKVFERAGLPSLVVVGAHAPGIQAVHPEIPAVLNPRWPDGQLSSVYVGLRAALAQGARQILVHPVDVPMIAVSTAIRVRAALQNSSAVIPLCEGKRGHPLGLRDDAARMLLGSEIATLAEAAVLLKARDLEVDDLHVLDNLNTAEAYRLSFGCAPRRR